jgi:hypothetical protein
VNKARNEMPSNPSKNAARSTETAQAPTQETPQTLADPLTPWRAALEQFKTLLAEVVKLSGAKTELCSERERVREQARQAADDLIGALDRTTLEPELERLGGRELLLGHQVEAMSRRLLPVQEKLQSELIVHQPAWARLAVSWQSCVLQSEIERIKIGLESNPELEAHALELARHSTLYRASMQLGPGGQSWNWTRPLTDTAVQKWAEVRDETSANLIGAANHLVANAEKLLEKAVTLAEVPPFTLPPPVVETHPEWNEALNADVALVDRLIAASGRKREDLTPAQLAILQLAAWQNDSYKRDREQAKYVVGVGEPTR